MKTIKTIDAIGHILCHDITQIIKDEVKGVAFKKGHKVVKEDIEVLLSLGKDNLYVWEYDETKLHENEAAEILANICTNENMIKTQVKEGKIDILADTTGMLKINKKLLYDINMLEDIVIATIHSNIAVKKGEKLAGTRVVPLVIDKSKLENVQKIAGNNKILEIKPFKNYKVGVVTTGNEVYSGRIKDTFTPVIINKVEKYSMEVVKHITVDDDKEKITNAIKIFKKEGIEVIICTGGMSVDPDDLTPTAIKECGANIVSYGAPVLPGSMFLLAYFDDGTTVLGLPGCVMYSKATIFDIVLPMVSSGEKINKQDLAKMGYGGLCTNCEICTYSNCGFGKGI